MGGREKSLSTICTLLHLGSPFVFRPSSLATNSWRALSLYGCHLLLSMTKTHPFLMFQLPRGFKFKFKFKIQEVFASKTISAATLAAL